MLRDIFLWSVYAGYSDIAFVILLQLNSRMTAALMAVSVARRLSNSATSIDARYKFDQQSKEYESYATKCITACYEKNKQLANKILLREHPLFGHVTCMQVSHIDFSYYNLLIKLGKRLQFQHVLCLLLTHMVLLIF